MNCIAITRPFTIRSFLALRETIASTTRIVIQARLSEFSMRVRTPIAVSFESCGSTTGVPAVSGAYLDAREIARLELTEELRFIDLAGSGGLTHIGADARLLTGAYKVAQRWAAALRLHPSKPDGIC